MQIPILGLLILAIFLPENNCFHIIGSDDWYKGGNFYQVYPRSFKDSDNDGIGDINGVTSKLEYLKDIGMDGIWLSPIFKSPMVDFGYDISNFYEIQPEYGTMEDFERLAAKCKALGIRLILDYVPNHCSDEHEWFQKSVNNEPGYEDLFIWHPGKINNVTGEREPPTNWIGVFRYSAWTWNEKRQLYYFHHFTPQQPDFNFRHPKVVEEMKNVLRFWLDKGVSGFRLDAVVNIFEISPDVNGNYPDEPVSGRCNDPVDPCYHDHIYTADQPESYDMVYQWRDVVDQYWKEHGGEEPVLMSEAYVDLDKLFRYCEDGDRKGAHIPFNFHLESSLNRSSTAADYKKLIEEYLERITDSCQANWVLGNHDRGRLVSRLGENRVDLYNILIKTLPGIAINYYGEEIGMTDVIISWEDTVDPWGCNKNETTYFSGSRDRARTPMQWDDSKNAGFSRSHKPWLPISSNYKCINVKTQSAQQRSHLNVYKRLVKLRKEAHLVDATYESTLFGEIFTYKRQSPSHKPVVVALNLGKDWQTIDLSTKYGLPQKLRVVTASIESQYVEGQLINGTRLTIPTDVGIVLTV